MISTILQRDPQSLRDKIAVWRQLSDILAQRGMQLEDTEILQSFQLLASLRSTVPENVRRNTAVSVARHGRFAPLVAFYAHDVASVAVAMLNNARLADADWIAMLPATGDVARSILASREDLSDAVKRALMDLGAGSVALPSVESSPETILELDQQLVLEEPVEVAPLAANADDQREVAVASALEQPWEEEVADAPLPETYGAMASLAELLKEQPAPKETRAETPEVKTSEAKTGEAKKPISQISELVRRIDKFQSSRKDQGKPSRKEPVDIAAISHAINADIAASVKDAPAASNPPIALQSVPQSLDADPLDPVGGRVDQFRFEAGADGLIYWVDCIAPQCIIGLSIAEAANGSEPGADGISAGAFRQQAEIVNARMVLAGPREIAGEWRFSADPKFETHTGQFQGYSGLARRPLRRERPYGQVEEGRASDSIRQLIHELRSPLNAISGFAQIISGQMFGPVSGSYRAMAETIIDDAMAIQAIIDNLHTATSKPAPTALDLPAGQGVDVSDVLKFVAKDLQMLATEQRIGLNLTEQGGPFVARGDEEGARRMIGRLLTALMDVAEPDSLLTIQLAADLTHDDMMQLRVLRPSAIRDTDAQVLLDPHVSARGEAPSADILALGFSLRLVGSLANALGGRLEIAQNSIILHLPMATSAGQGGRRDIAQRDRRLG
jgi:signal transduction histidine kinase